MSKERLEEIKKKYNYERLGEFIDAKPVNPYELKWLIEQAERAQELEKWQGKSQQLHESLKRQDEVLDRLRQQNKRYREAINNINEKAMLFGTSEEVYDAIQDAIKALEGEE